jgi:hypothetical protein
LNKNRLVEAEALAKRRSDGWACLVAEHNYGWVARHDAYKQEDEGQDSPERRDSEKKPLEDKPEHVSASYHLGHSAPMA